MARLMSSLAGWRSNLCDFGIRCATQSPANQSLLTRSHVEAISAVIALNDPAGFQPRQFHSVDRLLLGLSRTKRNPLHLYRWLWRRRSHLVAVASPDPRSTRHLVQTICCLTSFLVALNSAPPIVSPSRATMR